MRHGITVVLLLLVLQVNGGNADDAKTCQFGKDVLTFAETGPMEEDPLAAPLPSDFSIRSSAMIISHSEHLRFLEGVVFIYDLGGRRTVKTAMAVAPMDWNNVSRYVEPIKSQEQVICLLSILHPGYQKMTGRINASGLTTMLEAVRESGLPLRVREENTHVDLETLEKGLFWSDGKWFAHFIICENGTSVIEYKYVISDVGRIAGLRRVIVDGPDFPIVRDRLRGLPSTQDQDFKESREHDSFDRCMDFIGLYTIEKPPERIVIRQPPIDRSIEE